MHAMTFLVGLTSGIVLAGVVEEAARLGRCILRERREDREAAAIRRMYPLSSEIWRH